MLNITTSINPDFRPFPVIPHHTIPFQLFAGFGMIILLLPSWQLRNYEKLLGIYRFFVAIGKCKKVQTSGGFGELSPADAKFLLFAENVTACHTSMLTLANWHHIFSRQDL